MRRLLAILAVLVMSISLHAADMVMDATDTARNARAKIAGLLVNNPARSTTVTAAVQSLVTKYSLTSIDPATFGFFSNATGDNSVSITSGTSALTSASGRWTAADKGKSIDIAGAGPGGTTLRTVITAYTSAGSVTIKATASTTVTASKTSAAGLAVWGDDATLALITPTLTSASGNTSYQPGATVPADAANVKLLGAVGDGVADDTAAIQSALNRYDNVFIPAGTYKISGDGLQLRSNVTVFGVGQTSILKKSADTNAYVLYAATQSGITVRDLHLDGSRSYANDYLNSKFCLYLAACDRCLVSNVYAHGALADNIVIEYGKWNVITGCHSTNCNKNGIYLSGSEDCAVVGNVSSANGSNSTGGGIAASCAWGITIAGNTCSDNVQFDIIMSRGSRFCTITGNTCGSHLTGQAPLSIYCLGEPMGGIIHGVNYGAGSTYYGASDSVVSGNSCYAEMRMELLNDSVISGNILAKSADAGLWLTGCTRVSVQGNRVSGYTNSGIQLSPTAKNGTTQTTDCNVSGNAIYKAGGTAASALSKSGTGHIYGPNHLNGSPLESGGTWTPTITSNGVAPTFTYSEQLGSWSIIGDLVWVRCRVTVATVTSAGNGTLIINGWPMQSQIAEQSFLTLSRLENTVNAVTLTSAGLGVNSSSASIYYTPTSTGASSALTSSDALKAGFTFTATGCYRIATP